MPKEKLVQIEAWSYSRYHDYAMCPAKAKYKHVMKLREPENEAMAKGSQTHKLAEHYTRAILTSLPAVLAKFKKGFALLRKVKAQVEQEWAFTSDYRRVDWFAKDAWLRIKMDAHYMDAADTVHVIDHKTGKPKDDHELQRSLYAVGALTVYPRAKKIVVQHWYLETGEKAENIYMAKDIAALKKDWAARTKAMLHDKRFAPRPGNYCRWCHFRFSNGGPCKF